MITESKVKELVNSRIEGGDLFLVDINIGNSNAIRVLVDTMEGVRIEQCAELSRWLAGELDGGEENYSLEVSSPGLGSPLLVKQQYLKNTGQEVEVVFADGTRKKGLIESVGEDGIVLGVIEKMTGGGSQKKKKPVSVSRNVDYKDIKSTRVVIKF